MTLTAPIATELDHDGIEIVDDVQITDRDLHVEHRATAPVAPARTRDPLVPFLVLGILSWIGIIITASALAL